MNWITLLGISAGVLTTISFLPQVIKTWKTKHTKDISLSMYSIFVVGVLLWLVYGIVRQDIPIILANSVTVLLAGFVLIMKLIYK